MANVLKNLLRVSHLRSTVNLTAKRLLNYKRVFGEDADANLGIFSIGSVRDVLEAESQDVLNAYCDLEELEEDHVSVYDQRQAGVKPETYYRILSDRVEEAHQYLRRFLAKYPVFSERLPDIKDLVGFKGFEFDMVMTKEELEIALEKMNDFISFLREVRMRKSSEERKMVSDNKNLYHFSITSQYFYDMFLKAGELEHKLEERKENLK